MRRTLLAAAVVMLIAAVAAPVWAGDQVTSVIALHVTPHNAKTSCSFGNPVLTTPTSCNDYVSKGDLSTGYDTWLCIAGPAGDDKGEGYSGAGLGIYYDNTSGSGVDIFAWTACTDLQYPSNENTVPWPQNNSGNRMVWAPTTGCQRTEIPAASTAVHAALGFFYLYAYSPDILYTGYHPQLESGPEFAVVNCQSAVTDLLITNAGYAAFSSGAVNSGCNPCLTPNGCGPVPVQKTTWGRIKTTYQN